MATRPGSIPGTQKRRRAETSDKSQALKPVPPGRTLHDGRDTYPKGHCKARRLARESRPEGCLLHHPNPPIPQGVSKVQTQYQFNCLPFGLSSAPWVFTKTLKPVIALLREMGVRIIVYIDDVLIWRPRKWLKRH